MDETKGSQRNNFTEIAPRFGLDLVDPREQNRKRSRAYIEDSATEDRPKMARSWDAKMGSYICADPKFVPPERAGQPRGTVPATFEAHSVRSFVTALGGTYE